MGGSARAVGFGILGREGESQSTGQYGSVYGQNSGAGGRWAVQGGELYMSEAGGPLELVETVLKRNSNGYPVGAGVEYSQCN